MLAYPQNRIHLPLQGIAEMDMPARRLGQTVEQAAAVGARMAEELQEVSAAGELAAFAGRLSEMERETREELSTLPVRDWDYAWAQASEPRIREALSELPEQVRPVARELAERYVAQASISARRDYELEKIRAARQQWQRRVDESVAAGNGEAAEQWLRAGSRVFVPETELEEQAVSVRSRSALRYWQNALEQDAGKIREWEGRYGPVAAHFLPHDAARRDPHGHSYVESLAAMGLHAVRVVPRTPDVWRGINVLRGLLSKSWFHRATMAQRVNLRGDKEPSGLACLEMYRTAPAGASGVCREAPLHDAASHSADAARTFAEAHSHGLVAPVQSPVRSRRALM